MTGESTIDVIDALSDLFIPRGVPDHVPCRNGSARSVPEPPPWCLAPLGKRFIEPFNAGLLDDLLEG